MIARTVPENPKSQRQSADIEAAPNTNDGLARRAIQELADDLTHRHNSAQEAHEINFTDCRLNEVLEVTSHTDSYSSLHESLVEHVMADLSLLLKSTDYLRLSKENLLVLLQAEKLDLEEIEIWDRILKWGFARIE